MIALLLLTAAPWGSPQDTLSPAARRILADVQFLAADSQEGRGVGTAGLQRAGAYIRDGLARAGLRVSFQDFTIPADAPAVLHTTLGGTATRNVVAIIPGSARALRREMVVIGAHYDHLGLGGFGALDPDSTGKVHNGADDNASGTAALLEIGRRLARRHPARTVVLVAFSGEELGTIGSLYFVHHSVPEPIDSLYTMLNLDMVGRLRNARLMALGAGTAREFPALLDSLNTPPRFDLRASGDGLGTQRSCRFLRDPPSGAALLHRFARRLSPLDRRLGKAQRHRNRAGRGVRRRSRLVVGQPDRSPDVRGCAASAGHHWWVRIRGLSRDDSRHERRRRVRWCAHYGRARGQSRRAGRAASGRRDHGDQRQAHR